MPSWAKKKKKKKKNTLAHGRDTGCSACLSLLEATINILVDNFWVWVRWSSPVAHDIQIDVMI